MKQLTREKEPLGLGSITLGLVDFDLQFGYGLVGFNFDLIRVIVCLTHNMGVRTSNACSFVGLSVIFMIMV